MFYFFNLGLCKNSIRHFYKTISYLHYENLNHSHKYIQNVFTCLHTKDAMTSMKGSIRKYVTQRVLSQKNHTLVFCLEAPSIFLLTNFLNQQNRTHLDLIYCWLICTTFLIFHIHILSKHRSKNGFQVT